MPASKGANPKALLAITGAVEAATGLALLLAPSVLLELLLGAAPDGPVAMTVSRVAGAALLALGVACWSARDDVGSRAVTGLIVAMLFYNVAVSAILVLARLRLDISGIALWPVVGAHVALAVWCVTCVVTRTPSVKHR
ncbi:hypothetical protein [Ensifer canadensis]